MSSRDLTATSSSSPSGSAPLPLRFTRPLSHLWINVYVGLAIARSMVRLSVGSLSTVNVNGIAVHRKPIAELRSVTCHNVTCQLTQVNVPRYNPCQTGRYSIYLLWRDGRLSWPLVLVIYRDGLFIRRKSSISCDTTATRLRVEPTASRSQAQHPNRYTTKPPTYLLTCLRR